MPATAKDSIQVQKARKKLEAQFEAENQKMTPELLEKMRQTIRYWILRHDTDRIDLKDKAITLFDENQHAAQIKSRFVVHLLEKLKEPEAEEQKITKTSLQGRVSG